MCPKRNLCSLSVNGADHSSSSHRSGSHLHTAHPLRFGLGLRDGHQCVRIMTVKCGANSSGLVIDRQVFFLLAVYLKQFLELLQTLMHFWLLVEQNFLRSGILVSQLLLEAPARG